MPFLVCNNPSSIRVYTDAVCRSEPSGHNIRFFAIRGNTQQGTVVRNKSGFCVSRRFCLVKIARIISLKSHGKFMKMLSHLMIVIEALNPIDLKIAV